MVLGKLDRYMQKNETRPPTYTIHKNKLKMNELLKCKSLNHKNPGRKQAVKSQTFLIAIFFLIYLLPQEK